MQWLREQLEAIQRRLGGFDTSAKLFLGALVVILVLGLFLVAQYSGTKDYTPLAITAAARTDAERFLSERGHEFKIDGDKLLVPTEKHAAIIGQMSENGVGGGAAIDFEALLGTDNPFETARQNEQRKLVIAQSVLARTISGFKGVKKATVFIAPRPPQGLGTSSVPQSASVHVTLQSGATLEQSQVDAIAALVSGSQAGMRPEHVRITDGFAERRVRAGRDRLASENLEQQTRVGEAVRERIHTLLANIPGVLVSVNPQVVTKTLQATETKFGDGISVPTSESRLETATRGAAPTEAPGARPNVGMSVLDGRNASSATSEKQDTRFDTRIPATSKSEFDPTGYAVKIDVGVAVPWSYFRRVWELENPPAAGAATPAAPDDTAIGAVRDREITRIKKLLETQVATDAIENSKKGNVEVTWFYDFEAQAGAGVSSGGAAIIEAITPSSPGGISLFKTIALGALAILSLGMMLMMVRKASERPTLPSATELAGVPPTIEGDDADLIGEVEESTPPLEGMELDDRALQGQQMLAQLNDIVRKQPGESATLLKRWMKQG